MTSCLVCESKNLQTFKTDSRTGEELEMIKCNDCGYIKQNDYQDIYTTGEFSEIARQNASPEFSKVIELAKQAEQRINFYKEFVMRYDNFLEVGSSIGSFVHILHLMGKKATGLEPDKGYCDYSGTIYGFQQHCGLLEQFDPGKKFGALASFQVIEHVEDPDKYLAKSAELLEEGGGIIIECPSFEIQCFGDLKKTYWKPHVHYFSAPNLYRLACKYFKVTEVGFFGPALYLIGEKSSSKNNFSESQYKKICGQSSRARKVVENLSKLKAGQFRKKNLSRLAIQFLLEKNKKEFISRFTSLSKFGFRNLAYVFSEKKPLNTSEKKITHVSYYSGWANSGDSVLSQSVRKAIDIKFNSGYNLVSLVRKVDEGLLKEINESQFLLIGGGGLFLPDTNPNSISGWQWAAPEEYYEKINVPVVLFAVGYNFFPGQVPNDLFIRNLNSLAQRADFLSLRNTGSIQEVKKLIDPSAHERIHFQPCPTTIIRKIYDVEPKTKTKNVAINIALDRYVNRFGGHAEEILFEIGRAMKKISSLGYNVYNVYHTEIDKKFEFVLDSLNFPYKSMNLYHALPADLVSFYNNMELVIGMRGHGQMIPFGLNCKILTLGSHKKMLYFLQDINAEDWHVSLNTDIEHLSERITHKFNEIMENAAEAEQRIAQQQQKNFEITQKNLQIIDSIVKADPYKKPAGKVTPEKFVQ